MLRPTGPIATRVGAEDRWRNGQVSYVSGNIGNPLALLKRGVLSWLDLEFSMNLAYSQPAGAPAWTFNALAPWGLPSQILLDVGANTKFNSSVAGYDLMVRELYRHPAYTASYTAPLPAANAGTQPVTGNLAWSWMQRLPVTVDENDLTGLVLLNRQDAETDLIVNWNQVTAILSALPGGATATLTGAVNVNAYAYGLGQLQAPDLAFAHVLQSVPVTVPQQTSLQVPLLTSRTLQAIYMVPYVNGVPDVTSQITPTEVQLQIGDSRPYDIDVTDLQFANQLAARGSVPKGVLVFDRFRNRPSQYLNLFNVAQAFVNLSFSANPPAGATYNFLYEYLR